MSKAKWCSSALLVEIRYQPATSTCSGRGERDGLRDMRSSEMVTRLTRTLLEEEDGKVRDTASLGKAQYVWGRNLELFIYMPLALRRWPTDGKLVRRNYPQQRKFWVFSLRMWHIGWFKCQPISSYFTLHYASRLECGTRYVDLAAVECEVASVFLKALRDFTQVSLA